MNEARPRMLLLVAMLVLAFSGCSTPSNSSSTGVVIEGIIYSVEYNLEGGRTGGFTRANNSKAVPGGNGSWNIDAYGKLTHDYLFITRPQDSEAGTEVIPANRLINVRFGDGGIKQVKENQPAAPG